MASIPDDATNTFLSSLTDLNMWVGGQRLEADASQWGWSDGTTWYFKSWAQGKPSDENQKCLITNHKKNVEGPGKWDDKPCNDDYVAVCQQPVIIPDVPLTWFTAAGGG